MMESIGRRRGVLAAMWLVVFLVAGAAVASAQGTVALTVAERGGVARSDELIASGIPLPRSWGVTDLSALRLCDATGTSVPAQFEALSRWGAAADQTRAPVRWVLVQFPASLPASGTATLTLDRNGPGPAPTTPLQISHSV